MFWQGCALLDTVIDTELRDLYTVHPPQTEKDAAGANGTSPPGEAATSKMLLVETLIGYRARVSCTADACTSRGYLPRQVNTSIHTYTTYIPR